MKIEIIVHDNQGDGSEDSPQARYQLNISHVDPPTIDLWSNDYKEIMEHVHDALTR